MKLKKNLEHIKPYIAGKLKEGAVKLASNENPLGPSPMALESIKKFLDKIYLYPDTTCAPLKRKLAEKHGVTEDMIIVGNGSDEIFLFIAGAYLEKGRNAVTSVGTFPEYSFATTLFGGDIKYAEMNDLRYDLNNMLRLIDEHTQVIFIANPNNPTGTYVTHDEFLHFLGNVPDYMLIVLDEAYFEFAAEPDFPDALSLIKEHNNILILRTFSKLYGLAGLRIGYAIGSPRVISDLYKTKEPFNVNSVAQVAALNAMDDHEFVKKSLHLARIGKEYYYKEFDALNLTYWKSATNFVLFRIGMDAREAFEILMERGVTVRPISIPGYHDLIRVSVGTMEQNELFIRLLKGVV
jgi:histidinol-phosphate aminotransferase